MVFLYDSMDLTTCASVRHIPEWLLWLSYKPLARIGHNLGNQVLYPPLQFVKEGIVRGHLFGHHSLSNKSCSQIVFQLNGTALPSLALENFQEVENLKLRGSDHDEADEMIAGALGLIYASAKINISYSILFNLTTSYSSYFGGKKGISRNKTSFFLLMCRLVFRTVTAWITLKLFSTTAASDTVSQWTIPLNTYTHQSLNVIYQTVSALMSLFVVMLLHPNVQKKAQEEVDFIIGRERLPTFEDCPRLPFIDAVCKELLRWRPVNPLGTFCSYKVSPPERHYTYNVLAGRYPTHGHKRQHICRFLHTKR